MEINDLKTIWKKANDRQEQGYWISTEELRAMIHKKSQVTIAKAKSELKQKTFKSAGIGILTLVIGVVMTFFMDPEEDFMFDRIMSVSQYGTMMLVMSATILGISVHTRIRYVQIQKLEEFDQPITTFLSKVNALFGKLMKAGTFSDSLVTPLIMSTIAYMALYKDSAFHWDIRVVYLVGVYIISLGVFYKLSLRFMKKRYGRFIQAVNGHLEELDTLDSENSESEV